MDADDLYNRNQGFADALEASGREVEAGVRKRAIDLVSDAQDLAAAAVGGLNERYYKF